MNLIVHLILLPFFFLSFFLWTVIHEFSHLIAAKLVTDVNDYEVDLVPKLRGRFVSLGRIDIDFYEYPSEKGTILILLAPRIPDLIASVMLPLMVFLPFPWGLVFSVFWIGGILDLLNGSMGIHPKSDLRLATKDEPKARLVLSLLGFSIGIASVLIWFYLISL